MGNLSKLTAVKVKTLRQPGRYGDGQGLYLNIAPGGSKSWVQRIAVDGKRRDLGLGGYPAVGLAQARESAGVNRQAVQAGNPIEGRRAAAPDAQDAPKNPTFRQAAAIVHAMNNARWENDKTQKNWWQRAERYVFPSIGDIAVDHLGRAEVLGILTPVWAAKPETARRIRLILKTVMSWAMAYGYIQVNPAGEIIDAALPAMPKFRQHFRTLPYPEVAGAIGAVEASTAFRSTKLAFKFLVLTAARSVEVRGATWDEIDWENAVWTIPANRMKMRRGHRVPMSTEALAVLQAAQDTPTEGSRYIFPNDLTPHKMLSDNALSYLLNRIGVEAVPHGFRSSFRDWAAENTDASFAVMELALAHDVGNAVVQSYARTDLLERRRGLMQQWADYLNVGAAKC